MSPNETPAAGYRRIRQEAEILAGGLTDLARRASVYHHMYAHSGGNHTFPLLAAHGAMWARGYFAHGMRVGSILALMHVTSPAARRDRMEALCAFANAFREINRRVCVETYTAYHFTRLYGDTGPAAALVPGRLLDQLNECHAARRAGRVMEADERRALFAAFFMWEQDCIVGPAVDAAFSAFAWQPIEWLARRPRIAFAYIPRHRQFRFRDFASKSERIARGLQAFDLAEEVGWTATEHALRTYDILPTEFFGDAAGYFERLRDTLIRNDPFPFGPEMPAYGP